MIPVFYPYIPEEAITELSKTLQTRWIGQGPQVDKFEELIRTTLGFKYPVTTNSGTSALHLAYILAGIKEGDEVIVPVLTCCLGNMPLLYQGAKIVFADVLKNSMTIDPDDVFRKITKKTKAIVCTSLGGHPCEIDSLNNIAKYHKLVLIEDGCQALGAGYYGKPVGTLADYTAFSLQAIKVINSGDGGILCCPDEDSYKKAKRLRWSGIDREAKKGMGWEAYRHGNITYDIKEVGYKYHMTDINATLGIVGLQHLFDALIRRKQIADVYRDELKNIPGLRLPELDLKYYTSSNWLFHVFVDDRDNFMDALKSRGVETTLAQIRNDIYTVFGGKRQDLPNMNAVEEKYVYLPINMHITDDDVQQVISAIKKGW